MTDFLRLLRKNRDRALYLDVRVCISILHPRGDDPNGYELASECWAPVHTVVIRHNVVASDSPSITCGDLKREALAIEIWLQNTLKYHLQRVWVSGYLKASPRSEAASSGGGSQSTPIDHVQEETLRNKSWFIAIGGLTNKGRLYGVGKVSPYYRVGDNFTQQTSSAHDMDKIYQLEEQVRQSREEARQSREENACLSSQLQSLFHAVLPLLPADAHNILQDLNQQQ
ncbi:hypothetical protein Fmac_005040 [Flemingia macrophylla]|uniref:Uncharacterized protein n=1 Tax=Flemingia macrophylla TaxID=520843 RepID=A0ABD1N6L1_9FABA